MDISYEARDKLKKELESLSQGIDGQKTQIKSLKDEVKNLEGEKADAIRTLSGLVDKISLEEKQHKELTGDVEAEIESLNNKHKSSKDKVKKDQEKLKALEAQIKDANSALSKTEKDGKYLEAEIAKGNDSMSLLNSKINDLVSEEKHLKMAVSELKKEVGSIDLPKLKDNLAGVKKELSTAREELLKTKKEQAGAISLEQEQAKKLSAMEVSLSEAENELRDVAIKLEKEKESLLEVTAKCKEERGVLDIMESRLDEKIRKAKLFIESAAIDEALKNKIKNNL